MNKILALREKRANLWNETKAFLDSHRGEDGMISAEDNATYEKMEADVVALGKEIERLERQAAIDRELDQPTASPLVSRPTAPTDRKQGRASDEYKKGMLTALRSNFKQISNVLQEGVDADGGYRLRCGDHPRHQRRRHQPHRHRRSPGGQRIAGPGAVPARTVDDGR